MDGHGDLLADDIFCTGDGVRILDCLEFDDKLRWLDGLDDASFLAMDLERLGAPDLARRFTSWYAEYSGDPGSTPPPAPNGSTPSCSTARDGCSCSANR